MNPPALSLNKILIDTTLLILSNPLFWMVILFFVLITAARIFFDLHSHKSKINWLMQKSSIDALRNLSPTDFEEYVAALFKKLGYAAETVGGRSDGGIDVVVHKDGKTHFIQCKKFVNRKVPVGAVRDFYGAIVDKAGSGKGYFITTNTFTLEAEKFAEDKPIELVDRFALAKYMKLANAGAPTETQQTAPTPKTCPECGGELRERRGKYGNFIGCSNYPNCKYTQKL